MINSTNTINIDGVAFEEAEFFKAINVNSTDKYNRWVIRPLAVLTAIGIGVAVLFASAFLLVLSLALIPLLAVLFWVVKTKVERDIAQRDPVVETQSANADAPIADVQTAG